MNYKNSISILEKIIKNLAKDKKRIGKKNINLEEENNKLKKRLKIEINKKEDLNKKINLFQKNIKNIEKQIKNNSKYKLEKDIISIENKYKNKINDFERLKNNEWRVSFIRDINRLTNGIDLLINVMS